MPLKPETITQIQTMLQANPVLLVQGQSLTEPAESAAFVINAAACQGIDVSAADVAVFFKESGVHQVTVSDIELKKIAAGAGRSRYWPVTVNDEPDSPREL